MEVQIDETKQWKHREDLDKKDDAVHVAWIDENEKEEEEEEEVEVEEEEEECYLIEYEVAVQSLLHFLG